MMLSPATLHQPTLPGMERGHLLVARDRGDTSVEKVQQLPDPRLDGAKFSTVDEAVRAANAIMVEQYADTRFGWFNRFQGRVNAIAVLDAAEGVRLVRSSTPLDEYQEQGGAFEKPRWFRSFEEFAPEHPDLAMLVGAKNFVELRQGGFAAPQPFPRG